MPPVFSARRAQAPFYINSDEMGLSCNILFACISFTELWKLFV